MERVTNRPTPSLTFPSFVRKDTKMASFPQAPPPQQHEEMFSSEPRSPMGPLKDNWARIEAARRRFAEHEAEVLRLRGAVDDMDLLAENEELRRRLDLLEGRPQADSYEDLAKQLQTALARLQVSTQRERQWQRVYLNVAKP